MPCKSKLEDEHKMPNNFKKPMETVSGPKVPGSIYFQELKAVDKVGLLDRRYQPLHMEKVIHSSTEMTSSSLAKLMTPWSVKTQPANLAAQMAATTGEIGGFLARESALSESMATSKASESSSSSKTSPLSSAPISSKL